MAQERPCARCIKRNIGHLCHDEPREPDAAAKKSKHQHGNTAAEEDGSPQQGPADNDISNSFDQSQDASDTNRLGLGPLTLSQGGQLQIVQPSPVSGLQANALASGNNQCMKIVELLEAFLDANKT